MLSVSIEEANTLFSDKTSVYNYLSKIQHYHLAPINNEILPKYFSVEYAKSLMEGKITCPKTNQLSTRTLTSKMTAFQLYSTIEDLLSKKNAKPTGFDPLRLPCKEYLIQYLAAIDESNQAFTENLVQVEREVPKELEQGLEIIKVLGIKKKRGFFTRTKEEIQKRNQLIQARKLKRYQSNEAVFVKKHEILKKKQAETEVIINEAKKQVEAQQMNVELSNQRSQQLQLRQEQK